MRVLLFSGGLDSTALAYWLRPDRLLFINYGQLQAEGELQAASQIAAELDLPLDIRVVDCRSFGAGDMAGKPSLSSEASEFWPYRNQLLITLAAMAYAAESKLVILIGTVITDRIHPDGTRKFLRSMQSVLSVQGNLMLEAPAGSLSSSTLQRRANVPIETLSWAFSCHRSNLACGQCRGCTKHFEIIRELRPH